MITLARGALAQFLVLFALTGSLLSQDGSTRPIQTVTRADYERWTKELSNWGRWGPDDELGALNLITVDEAGAGRGARQGGLLGVACARSGL